MGDSDCWGLADELTDNHLDEACAQVDVAYHTLKAEIFNPKSTDAEIIAAIRDLFSLGMMCGSFYTLQMVIDRLGQEAFLQLV